MASRNYGLAFDTPYNEKLLSILEKYDRDRDTNGEPDIFSDRMSGGSFLGSDTRFKHPHLFHPILGSMVREMGGGKFNLGKSLVSVGKKVGKVALPIAKKVGKEMADEAIQSYMSGQGVISAGAMSRPAGMVSPFIHASPPFHMVQSGTMAAYPAYNAIEMKALNGGAMCCEGCRGAGVGSGGKFDFGKVLKSTGKELGKVAKKTAKDVGKVALPIAKKVASKMADEAIESYMSGEGVISAGVGIMKKPRGRPKKMDGGKFNLGKSLVSVGKKVGKVALPIAKKVGKEMADEAIESYMSGKGVSSGAGVTDGRKKRAEIVKKIMKEKGLKMIEASKYVKANGLY